MSDLKPIPKELTKAVLQKLYFSMNRKEVCASINDIKKELRAEKFNAYEKNVRSDEFQLFVIEYGNPIGYAKLMPEDERLSLKEMRRAAVVKMAIVETKLQDMQKPCKANR